MMRLKRRINHTGRKKVTRQMVQIVMDDKDSSGVPSFSAELDLSTLGVKDEAKVFVEGYHRSTSQRFSAGSIGAPQPIRNARLDEIDLNGRVLFRIVVVDDDDRPGRLLASANQIAPESDGDQQEKDHLISVKTCELGDAPWSVDLNLDGLTKPVLQLNNRIPGAIDLLAQDARFQATVLPAVMREVYTFIGWDCDGAVDTDSSWQEQWLDFGQRLCGHEAPIDSDISEYRNWVDDVVEEFSRAHELVSRLAQKLEEDG